MSDTEDRGEEPVEAEVPETGPMTWLRDVVRSWGPAILAVIVIRMFIFEPFRIPSGSMVPTLLIGDHVLVTKYSYGLWLQVPWWIKPAGYELIDWGDPERGDIIVFRYPLMEKLTYIKRVVGLPGDRIRVSNNEIVLNGVVQERTYSGRYEFLDDHCHGTSTKHFVENLEGLDHHVLTNVGPSSPLANFPAPRTGEQEVTVPEDHVFVMGDNRDNSEDGRKWGFVSYDKIKGKAHFVWLSWNGCADGANVVRSERFFHGLYQEPQDPAAEGG